MIKLNKTLPVGLALQTIAKMYFGGGSHHEIDHSKLILRD